MTAILYIIGLIIGITAFLYILSSINSMKDKSSLQNNSNIKPKSDPDLTGSIEMTTSVKNKILNSAPGERICPLCGSSLTRFEALYASHISTDKGKKILIYGCRYCYKPEENPEEKKKSDIFS
jgi:rubredoxin